MSVKLPNGPSKTGNPSGKGRGNLPPKKKLSFFLCFAVLSLVFSDLALAQDKTIDLEIGRLQLTCPANYQVFRVASGGSSTEPYRKIIISSVSDDGREQRMQVFVEKLENIVTDPSKYAKRPSNAISWLPYNNLRYVDVEMEMKGVGNDFYYADYSAKYYYGLRNTADQKLRYINIKGRNIVKVLGGYYLLTIIMEVPEEGSFSSMMKIMCVR